MRLSSNQQAGNGIATAETGARNARHSALRIPRSKLIWFLIGLFALAPFATKLFADSNPPTSSNRWLFIIDTSSGMKRHQADILGVVNTVITNAATGQMRPGDSIGLWTFNQEVYSDLPAQTLTGDNLDQIDRRTLDFLKRQHYGKSSRLTRALSDMRDVISASDIITVFIISDGRSKMVGTPFDDDINALYRRNLEDMRGQPRPIVTVLQAKGGKLVKFTVNAVPWPVVIPELPLTLHLAETPAQPQKATPAPADNPAIANPPTTVKPPPQAKPLILSGPQKSAVTSAPSSAAPAPVVATASQPNVSPAPTPAPTPSASAPAPVVAIPPAAPSVSPQTLTPPSVHPPANLPAAPASASPNFIPPPPPNIPNLAAMTKPAATPTPPPPLANNETHPAVPPVVAPPVQTHPSVATESPDTDLPVSLPKQSTHATKPTESKPVATVAAAPTTNAPAPRALAFVAPDSGRPKSLLIAALGLMLVGIFLVIVVARRSRVTSGPSLITHTMGNDRKRG